MVLTATNNTWTGNTIINGGTLRSLSPLPTGAGLGFTVSRGGTLETNGFITGAQGTNAGNFYVGGATAAASTFSMAGVGGNLVLDAGGNGSGTASSEQLVWGSPTFNAPTTLIMGNVNSTGQVLIYNPIELQSGTTAITRTFTNNSTNGVSTATHYYGNLTQSGTAGAVSITINGGTTAANLLGGTTYFDGNNTFTGNINIASGSLFITNPNSLGTGTGARSVTLTAGTAGRPSLHLAPTGGGSINIPSNISFSTSSGIGSIVNENGNNSIAGNFTMTSGGGDTVILANGGTLTLSGNFSPNTTTRNLRLQGTAGNGVLSGIVADGSTVNMPVFQDAGQSTWTISGANTFTGVVTASSGTMIVGNNAPLVGSGPLGASTNSANLGGTTNNASLLVGGFNIGKNILVSTNSGAATLAVGSATNAPGTYSGSLAFDRTLNFVSGTSTNGLVNFSGLHTGTGLVNVTGPGTVVFSRTAGYTRPDVTVNAGTLQFGASGGTAVGAVNITNALTVNNGANVNFSPTGTTTTVALSQSHFIKTMSIASGTTSGGLVDIGNSFVYFDRATTPVTTVQSAVANAGNLNGFSNPLIGAAPSFDARGGLTSTVARASVINGDYKYGLGVIDGLSTELLTAARITSGPLNNSNASNSASFPGGASFASIPTNRVFASALKYGDANGDGVVNDTDVAVIVGLGLYDPLHTNASTTKGWVAGDFNGDGFVDNIDVSIFTTSSNYNPGFSRVNRSALGLPAAAPAGTSTPASAVTSSSVSPSRSLHPSVTTIGSTNDGTMAYIYDANTGDVTIRYNGDTRISASTPLQIISITTSGATTLNSGALNSAGFITTTYNTTTLNASQFAGSIADSYDLGNILAPYLSNATLSSDLTLRFQVQGGDGSLIYKAAELIVVIPEPSTIGLMAIGVTGFLARRRRRNVPVK